MRSSVLAPLFGVVAAVVLSLSSALGGEVLKAYAGTEEPVAKELFDAFEKETGIKVEWVRLSGGEAVARIEAEKANPQAAIWVGGVGTMHIELKNKGLTSPYASPVARNIPPKYRDKDNYWIGLYVAPISFCYNNKRMAELGLTPPTTWADLIKPEYRKQIRVAHPSTSGTAYNMVTNIIRLYNGDEDQAFAFMKKLADNIDQFTKSGSAPGKSCAIGEIPIAIGYRHDQLRLVSQGADLGIVVPSDGSGYETASMSLVKDGPNPVAAKKLYNWMISSEHARNVFNNWQMIPLVDSQDPDGFFQSLNLVDQDDVWDAANKIRLLDRWNREITAQYN
ncbi:MAG: ABC transporter substrate-binding protein [Planctomycetaceae bacterium]|nr:ABC transporter substrate-binding protein [Planctomycetaceae bacterium]